MVARSFVWIGQDLPGIEGLAKQQKAIARLPDGLLEALAPAVDKGADLFLETAKGVCPVNDLDPHPGDLQASGKKQDAKTAIGIGKLVVFDARDEHGRFYAKHVEAGHMDKRGGGHVPPKPWFWPAYQHVKKPIRAGIARAANRALKRMFGDAAS